MACLAAGWTVGEIAPPLLWVAHAHFGFTEQPDRCFRPDAAGGAALITKRSTNRRPR